MKSSQTLPPNHEASIWARLMQAHGEDLAPDVAECLLSFDFGQDDLERMHQLAERSQSGELTIEEQREFDSYLHIGNLLAVMRSKARVALARKPSDSLHS